MDYTTVDHPDDSDSLVEVSSDQNPSSPVTPKSDTIPVDLNFDHQSGSDVSPDHDSDGSSYSELDSEAEAFYSTFNHNLLSSGDMDDHDLAAEKQRSFGLLMKKNAQLEEELRTMSLKLQESEQENEKLKSEAEKRESAVLLAENLRAELETARREIEMRNVNLETEKGEAEKRKAAVLLAENLRAELETARREIEMRNIDLETEKGEAKKREAAVLLAEKNLRAELETAQREIELRDIYLRAEKRQVLELERKVVDLESNLLESSLTFENLANELKESRESLDVSDAEISKLREMLCDCQQSFSTEKTKLVNDNADLLAKKTFSEEWNMILEDQIRAHEMEMQRKEVELQAEINALRIDLALRNEHVEALNKAFDKYKHRYDMLMVEKDGVYANLDNLKAEMRSKDIQIELLHNKQTKLVEELTAKVKELEKHVEMQRNVIAEVEEEKREVIRQLCFCLDHYQTGYKQLLQVLLRNKKQQQGI